MLYLVKDAANGHLSTTYELQKYTGISITTDSRLLSQAIVGGKSHLVQLLPFSFMSRLWRQENISDGRARGPLVRFPLNSLVDLSCFD